MIQVWTFALALVLALAGPGSAGWFPDRSNRMVPVDIDGTGPDATVGRAMTIQLVRGGANHGIQICPGVFVATAHGVLNDAVTEAATGGASLWSFGAKVAAHHFPLDRNEMRPEADGYVSPVLRDPATRGEQRSDYVLYRVEEPERPDDHVTPLTLPMEELSRIDLRRDVEVLMFRGRTRFEVDAEGRPDGDTTRMAGRWRDLRRIYDAPQMVGRDCSVDGSPRLDGTFVTDCPVEHGVSGAPLIARIGDRSYLLGIAINEVAGDHPRYRLAFGNGVLPAAEFCGDYEEMCGRPCATATDVGLD